MAGWQEIKVLYGRVVGVSVPWFYHVWTPSNAPNENFTGRGGGQEAFGGSAMGRAVYGRVAGNPGALWQGDRGQCFLVLSCMDICQRPKRKF